MKRINWVFVIVVLIGFVVGGFIGTYFSGSFLNYGKTFGMNTPVELDFGFLIFTIGLKIQITIASVLGVILSLLIYKFIK